MERKGLRIRWTDLQTSANFEAACPGDCLIAAQRGSRGQIIGQNVSFAAAWSAVRLQTFDIEGIRKIASGEGSEASASFGLSYARVLAQERVYYRSSSAVSAAELQSRTHGQMLGPKIGLEGALELANGLRAAGRASGALMAGRSQQDATEIGSTLGVSQSGVSSDAVVPLLELGAGIVYSPAEGCEIRLGLDFLELRDALARQTFAGTNTASSEITARRTVSFFGPRLAASWRF